jgi:repressor of nif and glnA expression
MVMLGILRDAGTVVGSAEIARELVARGHELSPRTVRVYLQQMAADGLVEEAKRGRAGGRRITDRGRQEIDDSLIFDRIGFTAAKVDAMAWQMQFDLRRRQGRIVLNLTVLPRALLAQAVAEMAPVFAAGLGMGEYVALFQPGERVGAVDIPADCVGLGTVCSVTINGILLNARVPVVSRFGGVLEFCDHEPRRFTDVIYYDGTSMDPLEIFIKAGLTSVRQLVRTGHGRLGVSFREVPTCALPTVEALAAELRAAGLSGILQIGRPNQPMLGVTVPEGRTGVLVIGGLNPVAAIYESGIITTNRALCTLVDFRRLVRYSELVHLGGRLP